MLSGEQRSAKFFCERSESKHFRPYRPYGLCCNDSTLLGQHKLKPQTAHKWMAWLCSDKALFVDTEIWISHNFQGSWNILFNFFFLSFKNMESMPGTQALWKEAVSQVWPMDYCVLDEKLPFSFICHSEATIWNWLSFLSQCDSEITIVKWVS